MFLQRPTALQTAFSWAAATDFARTVSRTICTQRCGGGTLDHSRVPRTTRRGDDETAEEESLRSTTNASCVVAVVCPPVQVVEAQVNVTCFWVDPASGRHDTAQAACGKPLSNDEVRRLLRSEDVERYDRFLASASNPNVRQCPNASCGHTMTGDPKQPAMTCDRYGREPSGGGGGGVGGWGHRGLPKEDARSHGVVGLAASRHHPFVDDVSFCCRCGFAFCLVHSIAHPPTVTCEAYERQQLLDDKVSRDMVNTLAKRCPNPACGIPIVKTCTFVSLDVFVVLSFRPLSVTRYWGVHVAYVQRAATL